jgi:hypothetical protein
MVRPRDYCFQIHLSLQDQTDWHVVVPLNLKVVGARSPFAFISTNVRILVSSCCLRDAYSLAFFCVTSLRASEVSTVHYRFETSKNVS